MYTFKTITNVPVSHGIETRMAEQIKLLLLLTRPVWDFPKNVSPVTSFSVTGLTAYMPDLIYRVQY